jgi:phosphoribosylformimino-5-aminoimidazole carboxamide ribotide isomerase
MTRFRGCIDIHSGSVKQIVGGTLSQDDNNTNNNNTIQTDDDAANAAPPNSLATNFVSNKPASYYAALYRDNSVHGTHVIKLGSNPANDKVASLALETWPHGLQIGGGITLENAQYWLDAGASHVIVTSWLFPGAQFSIERLRELSSAIGRERIVVDLSCRRREDQEGGVTKWFVATDKWRTMTDFELCSEAFATLGEYCAEFLVHAADVEGLCQGIDEDLVVKLGEWCNGLPVTYAGGAKSVDDLRRVQELSQGKVDLTYGSALDIFGGELVTFQECVEWNEQREIGRDRECAQ